MNSATNVYLIVEKLLCKVLELNHSKGLAPIFLIIFANHFFIWILPKYAKHFSTFLKAKAIK